MYDNDKNQFLQHYTYWASCGVADLLVNERQSIHHNKR